MWRQDTPKSLHARATRRRTAAGRTLVHRTADCTAMVGDHCRPIDAMKTKKRHQFALTSFLSAAATCNAVGVGWSAPTPSTLSSTARAPEHAAKPAGEAAAFHGPPEAALNGRPKVEGCQRWCSIGDDTIFVGSLKSTKDVLHAFVALHVKSCRHPRNHAETNSRDENSPKLHCFSRLSPTKMSNNPRLLSWTNHCWNPNRDRSNGHQCCSQCTTQSGPTIAFFS